MCAWVYVCAYVDAPAAYMLIFLWVCVCVHVRVFICVQMKECGVCACARVCVMWVRVCVRANVRVDVYMRFFCTYVYVMRIRVRGRLRDSLGIISRGNRNP